MSGARPKVLVIGAGIIGASVAPYIATWLAANYGLAYVGYYMALAGAVTLTALLLMREPSERSQTINSEMSVDSRHSSA